MLKLKADTKQRNYVHGRKRLQRYAEDICALNLIMIIKFGKIKSNKQPGYNPKRVAINNVRRQCWTDCPETERYPFSYDGADFDQWGDCEFGIHD